MTPPLVSQDHLHSAARKTLGETESPIHKEIPKEAIFQLPSPTPHRCSKLTLCTLDLVVCIT